MTTPEPRSLHRGWAVLLVVCLLAASLCGTGCDETKEYTYPTEPETPPAVRYYGIWGTGPNDLFAVGQPGLIVHSADNGATWIEMDSPTAQPLTDVWGTAGDDVYACGHAGTILHYNGSSWSNMTSGTSENLYSIGEFEDGEIYVSGYHGTVRRLSGNSWVDADDVLSMRNEVLDFLRPAPRDTILSLTTVTTYAFGGSDCMLIMADPEEGLELRNCPGGEAWISAGFSNPEIVEGNYLVANDGKFFGLRESNIQTIPGGEPIWRKTWIRLNDVVLNYTPEAVNGMWASEGDTTFHATFAGHVLMMPPDDGESIITPLLIYPPPGVPIGAQPALFDLTGFSSGNLFAVGADGVIMHGSATGDWERIVPDVAALHATKGAIMADKFAPTGY